AAQPDMKRHHGALAEADERQRRRRKLAAPELGVEEAFENGCRLVDAGPSLLGVSKGERKPLAAHGRLSARTRRVRRSECRIRQQALPGAPEVDEIVAIGAVAVEKDDKLACAA